MHPVHIPKALWLRYAPARSKDMGLPPANMGGKGRGINILKTALSQ